MIHPSSEAESEFNNDDGPLKDDFDRPMKSLRISVTDRCNLACTYCMPEGGPDHHSPKEEILSYEEITELTKIFVDLGVDNARLTGGEPLLRNELHKLVDMLNEIEGLEEITMTTNGYYLTDHIDELDDAGLDRINFSLDTFDRERFQEISRRKGFSKVMDGLQALLDTPSLYPVKMNVVPVREFNQDEIPEFVQWALEHQQHVRFIEYMPLEGGYHWSEDQAILTPELKELITEEYDLSSVDDDPHSTSTTFHINDSSATVGFITSVSDPFCGTCDRVRLTADGQVKNCLFAYEEDSLKDLLRSGAKPRDIKRKIRQNYKDKWEGGCAKLKKNDYDPSKISRTMSRVGG